MRRSAVVAAELPLLREISEGAGHRLGVIGEAGRPQARSFAEDVGVGLVNTEVGHVSSVESLLAERPGVRL